MITIRRRDKIPKKVRLDSLKPGAWFVWSDNLYRMGMQHDGRIYAATPTGILNESLDVGWFPEVDLEVEPVTIVREEVLYEYTAK